MLENLVPAAAETGTDVALDIRDQSGGDPPYAAEVGPLDLRGEPCGDFGNEFVRSLREMTPQMSVKGIEARPQRQPEQNCGDIARDSVTLGFEHKRRQNSILDLRIPATVMEHGENGSGIHEGGQLGLCPAQGCEVFTGRMTIEGLHEIGMDRLPEGTHRTPALRPGIGCLLMAWSGRRAPLSGKMMVGAGTGWSPLETS